MKEPKAPLYFRLLLPAYFLLGALAFYMLTPLVWGIPVVVQNNTVAPLLVYVGQNTQGVPCQPKGAVTFDGYYDAEDVTSDFSIDVLGVGPTYSAYDTSLPGSLDNFYSGNDPRRCQLFISVRSIIPDDGAFDVVVTTSQASKPNSVGAPADSLTFDQMWLGFALGVVTGCTWLVFRLMRHAVNEVSET